MQEPNSTQIHMFRNTDAPALYLLTRLFGQCIGLTGLYLYAMYLIIVVKALRRKGGRKNESKRQTLFLLLGNILFTILTAIWNTSLTFLSGLEYDTCNYWGRSGGIYYVMCHFFSYCILLQRAIAVGSVQGSGRIEKILYKVTLFAVKIGTAFVPLLSLLTFVLFRGVPYFKEEFCVQNVDYVVAWLFMILDTGLSAGYLLLFVLPVVIHMRKMSTSVAVQPKYEVNTDGSTNSAEPGGQRVGAGAGAKKQSGDKSKTSGIRATAVRNLKISSSAIGATVFYMMGTSLAATFVSGDDDDLLPIVWLQNWQQFIGSGEMIIGTTCNMLMCKNLWTTESNLKRKLKQGVGIAGGGGAAGPSGDSVDGPSSVATTGTVSTAPISTGNNA